MNRNYDGPLSDFAFNGNLRPHTLVLVWGLFDQFHTPQLRRWKAGRPNAADLAAGRRASDGVGDGVDGAGAGAMGHGVNGAEAAGPGAGATGPEAADKLVTQAMQSAIHATKDTTGAGIAAEATATGAGAGDEATVAGAGAGAGTGAGASRTDGGVHIMVNPYFDHFAAWWGVAG